MFDSNVQRCSYTKNIKNIEFTKFYNDYNINDRINM